MPGYAFTPDVRLALARGRDHAAELSHEYVGTEHLLLGLLDESDGDGAAVLDRLGLDRAALRVGIRAIIRPGTRTIASEQLPYTSRAKKVLELAMMAARDEGVDFVGSEHLLVGMLREEKGIAAQALAVMAGVHEEALWQAIREVR